MDKFQLLNKSEQLLYSRLCEAAPSFIVFSQVSMSQIFHIQKNKKNGFTQINEIGKKSIDFLLCRKDTSMVLAIELNGPMHEKEEQKTSDEKKRATLEQAGIPLIIFKPDEIPSARELTAHLAPYVVERRKNETEKNENIQAAKDYKEGKITCENCEKTITINIAKYCLTNREKFKHKILCIDCQKIVNGNQ
jgi:very-short-patch-repair endonuclease